MAVVTRAHAHADDVILQKPFDIFLLVVSA